MLRETIIAQDDLRKLREEIREELRLARTRHAPLAVLEAKLRNARIVPSDQVPEDLVTMNSRLWVRDIPTGVPEMVTLVYPLEADLGEGKISVFSPLGTTILGKRVGEMVRWCDDEGRHTATIESALLSAPGGGNPASWVGKEISPMWSEMPHPHTAASPDGLWPSDAEYEPFLDFDPVGDWPEWTGQEKPDHGRDRSPRDASG